MDINAIVTLINSCGFPICTAGFLAWYMVKCNARTNEILTEFRETLAELKASIENLKREEDK